MHGSLPEVSAFRLEEERQKPGKLFGGGFARRPGLPADVRGTAIQLGYTGDFAGAIEHEDMRLFRTRSGASVAAQAASANHAALRMGVAEMIAQASLDV